MDYSEKGEGAAGAPDSRWDWRQPAFVLPVGVPGEAILLHDDDTAVWVGTLRAFPTGFDFQVRVMRRPGSADDRLRLEIGYPDGRRAAFDHGRPNYSTWSQELPLRLTELASSGSTFMWEGRFWVHPLPPDGPVTLTGSWPPARGTATFDGTAIRAAADRSVALWPDLEERARGGGAWSRTTD